MPPDKSNGLLIRVLTIATPFVLSIAAVLMAIIGFLLTDKMQALNGLQLEIVEIKTSLAALEANRFTTADAHLLWQKVASKADKSDVPPPQVKEALARLEKVTSDTNTQVFANSKAIERLMAAVEQVRKGGSG